MGVAPAGSWRECNPQPPNAVSSARIWPSSSCGGAPAWPRLPPPSRPPLAVWTTSSSCRSNKLAGNTAHVCGGAPSRRRGGDEEEVGLTVFGLGLQRAVLGTLVRHQNRTEEVGTALQLQAHRPAEVGDLLRQPDDAEGGAVRLPFVSVENVFMRSFSRKTNRDKRELDSEASRLRWTQTPLACVLVLA